MNDLLTPDELRELTGAKIPSKQREMLTKNHIPFIVRLDGKPRVTWTAINNRLTQPETTEINTEWMQ